MSNAKHIITTLQLELEAIERQRDQLLATLKNITSRYAALLECGDCGLWDAEKESEVIEARAAIAAVERSEEGSPDVRIVIEGPYIRKTHIGFSQYYDVRLINQSTHTSFDLTPWNLKGSLSLPVANAIALAVSEVTGITVSNVHAR